MVLSGYFKLLWIKKRKETSELGDEISSWQRNTNNFTFKEFFENWDNVILTTSPPLLLPGPTPPSLPIQICDLMFSLSLKPLSPICVGNILWRLLEQDPSTQDHILQGNFFLRNCQSSIASQVAIRLHAYLPSPCWYFFFWSCTYRYSHHGFICINILLFLEKSWFLHSSTASGSNYFYSPSSKMIPKTWEDGVWYQRAI